MGKDIYVVIEQRKGRVQKVGLELLGEAQRLAADLGQQVVAVLMGHNVAQKAQGLVHSGADRVILVDDPMLETYVTEPYARALTAVIEKFDPEILLFGATSIGRDLAPRVAARVHTGLTADCTALEIDPEEKLLLMTRPAFGGNLMATIVCRDYRPQMATVRPGVMKRLEPDAARTGAVEKLEVAFTPADMNVKVQQVCQHEGKAVDITAAKVLVAGGRGVGGPDGYAPLHALAAELSGEVAATRIGVDSGWIEKDRQVGQTGKTVRPQLYMACGVSGALQHVAGMEESDFIIAINRDENAPIMAMADLAVVGDLNTMVPKLTRAIQQHKAQKAQD
ncbi:electron transfer flavoprotein subunit alpha/FixB family protein [Ruminococcaceae bacterium OttesenSCG-928-D13]|nr:electron transfer flavoprotein subunit alpha/FixB family protein [Ruminococcaceae bacterium OttesenSCG-928-D13]